MVRSGWSSQRDQRAVRLFKMAWRERPQTTNCVEKLSSGFKDREIVGLIRF
jgi:hypothetical protein